MWKSKRRQWCSESNDGNDERRTTGTEGIMSTFTIGSVSAAAGAVASGALTVPARTGDSGTTIPFSIIHGNAPGPVLALVAGTHGSEYVPIIALQRLRFFGHGSTTLSSRCNPEWLQR